MPSAFNSIMTDVAKSLCASHGEVSIDMVRLAQPFIEPEKLNQWGGIFKGSNWKCIGTRQSSLPRARGRTVKIWKYIGQ
jgi:hypothetical protein